MPPAAFADRFFQDLNYAAANEDSRSELAALALRPDDHVLCVTGSGARPLDLLLGDPARVVALDLNPTQGHLLQLKLAAYRHLDHPALLGFLGVSDDPARLQTYARLRGDLTDAARDWLDARPALVTGGVLYSGRWERYLRWLAAPLQALRGRTIERLFQAADLAEQQQIWRASWDNALWRGALRAMAWPWLWRTVMPEPGIEQVPDGFDLYGWVYGAFDRSVGQFLLRESDFAWLIFHGRYATEGPLPLHLQAEHFDAIRDRLDRIEVVCDDLLAHLDAGVTYDAYSLSDFSSYTDDAAYATVWAHVVSSARPGARVCERHFFLDRDPSGLDGRIVRDRDLETTLSLADRAIFYRIVAARIDPP